VDPAGDADLGDLLGAGEALSAGAARRRADLRSGRNRRGDAAAALLRERAARPAALAERGGSGRGALRRDRGVAVVGANAAGFTLPLLPAFGTVLAILLLGESFRGFHGAGFATILAGVILATWRPGTD